MIEQIMPPPSPDWDFLGGLGDLFGTVSDLLKGQGDFAGPKPKKEEDGVDDLPEDDDKNEL